MIPRFTVASFWKLLFRWHSIHLVEQVANEVARQCRAGLWRRVNRRTCDMSIAQVRGYARAQAAWCACDEVDRTLCERGLVLKPKVRNRVVQSAIDQLVAMVIHDVLSNQAPTGTKTIAA
jgi:hypothetical protein